VRSTWASARVRLIAFALLCALPVLLLTVLQFLRETERIRETAIQQVRDDADMLVRRLEQDLVGAETVAHALGGVDLARPGAPEACSRALRQAMATAGPRVTNFLVVSPTADVVCSARPIPPASSGFDRPHVQQALRTGRPVLSGFVVGRVTGQDRTACSWSSPSWTRRARSRRWPSRAWPPHPSSPRCRRPATCRSRWTCSTAGGRS
jgi:hypothetical protein